MNQQATVMQDSPVERATRLNMTYVDPDRAVVLVMKHMMEDFWRTTPHQSLREKLAAAYKRLVGAPIRNFAGDSQNFNSVNLKGPPGHGKTSIVREASRHLAHMLDMNFHETLGDELLGENDFVFLVRELTGETSTLTTRGIFDRAKVGDRDVTRRLPYQEFEIARSAGLATLLFDDVTSALDVVQTSLLGLVRQRHSEGQSYRNMAVVLAGNLGLEDGTMTNAGTSALVGRSLSLYVEDDVEGFCSRVHAKFGGDEMGDGFVTAYLRHHKDQFSPTADLMTDTRSPRPSPRSWEAVVISMRSLVNAWQHAPNSALFADTASSRGITGAVEQTAAQSIGISAAKEFASFCQKMMSDTYPLVQRIFEKGVPNAKAEIDQVIARAGQGKVVSPERNEAAFQAQYAEACASVAAAKISSRMEEVKADPAKLRQVLREELCTYLLAMNEPYPASQFSAFIATAYQARATWTLGRRLASLAPLASAPSATDAVLERRRLRHDIASQATIDAVNDCNQVLKDRYGRGAYSPESAVTHVLIPLTGDGVAAATAATAAQRRALPDFVVNPVEIMPKPATDLEQPTFQ